MLDALRVNLEEMMTRSAPIALSLALAALLIASPLLAQNPPADPASACGRPLQTLPYPKLW